MQGQVAVALCPRCRAAREHPLTFDYYAQPMCQYVCPAGLVDKVDGAAIERLEFSLDHKVSGQKDDRHFDTALSEGAQQLEPRHLRQNPVEQRNLCLDPIAHGIEERTPVGKTRDRKPPVCQVCGHGFPIMVVVIDQNYVGHVGATFKRTSGLALNQRALSAYEAGSIAFTFLKQRNATHQAIQLPLTALPTEVHTITGVQRPAVTDYGQQISRAPPTSS